MRSPSARAGRDPPQSKRSRLPSPDGLGSRSAPSEVGRGGSCRLDGGRAGGCGARRSPDPAALLAAPGPGGLEVREPGLRARGPRRPPRPASFPGPAFRHRAVTLLTGSAGASSWGQRSGAPEEGDTPSLPSSALPRVGVPGRTPRPPLAARGLRWQMAEASAGATRILRSSSGEVRAGGQDSPKG